MKMDKQRWQQVETIYHATLERAPDERAAFLAEICADDSDLRREAALVCPGATTGPATLLLGVFVWLLAEGGFAWLSTSSAPCNRISCTLSSSAKTASF